MASSNPAPDALKTEDLMEVDEPSTSRRSIFTPRLPQGTVDNRDTSCCSNSSSSQGTSDGHSGSPTEKWHFNPLFYYFSTREINGTSFNISLDKFRYLAPDGKVLKSLIKEGSGEPVPEGGRAWVDYMCFVEGVSTPFDFTIGYYGPRTYRLGCGEMISGVEVALLSMKVGEVSKFLFDPAYAYGKFGCPPTIPPNARIFMIIKVARVSADPFENSEEEDDEADLNGEDSEEDFEWPDGKEDDSKIFDLSSLKKELPEKGR